MCIRTIIDLETTLMEIKKISGHAATTDKTVENLQLLIHVTEGWFDGTGPLACLSPFAIKLVDKDS